MDDERRRLDVAALVLFLLCLAGGAAAGAVLGLTVARWDAAGFVGAIPGLIGGVAGAFFGLVLFVQIFQR
jgi:hypothetical protein